MDEKNSGEGSASFSSSEMEPRTIECMYQGGLLCFPDTKSIGQWVFPLIKVYPAFWHDVLQSRKLREKEECSVSARECRENADM